MYRGAYQQIDVSQHDIMVLRILKHYAWLSMIFWVSNKSETLCFSHKVTIVRRTGNEFGKSSFFKL